MSLTIYDIAKEAGVSITTVSRVLNSKGEVSVATRAKIQAVLEKSGYAPSQLARGLASKLSKTVGIVAVDLRASHHANLVHQTEYCLSQQGYSAIVCSLAGKPDRLDEYIEMLLSRQVDGIVFTGSVFAGEPYHSILAAKFLTLPCVVLNALLPEANFFGIINDECAAFADVVRLLYSKGRRNLAFLGGAPTLSEEQKRLGYRTGMERVGLGKQILEYHSPHDFEAGYTATQALMREHPETDAIICSVDPTAVGCIHALHHMGYRVPGQISVVGANNTDMALACYPQLTSVDTKPYETSDLAVKMLVEAIEEKNPEKVKRLDCRLVQRHST